jgi:hypothetical protein
LRNSVGADGEQRILPLVWQKRFGEAETDPVRQRGRLEYFEPGSSLLLIRESAAPPNFGSAEPQNATDAMPEEGLEPPTRGL